MGRHSRAIKAVCVTGAVVGMTLLGATATIAQEASVTVDISKDVFGTAPAGSTFEVTYTCEVPGNPDGNFSGTAQFRCNGGRSRQSRIHRDPGYSLHHHRDRRRRGVECELQLLRHSAR